MVKALGAAPESDLLSRMLGNVRLRGEHVLRCAPPTPFSVSFPDSHGVLHLVDRGEVEISLQDARGGTSEPVLLQTGDVALLPRGHEHVVRTQGTTEPTRRIASADLIGSETPQRPVKWLCGSFVRDDDLADDMLMGLPPLITFQRSEHGTPDWLAVNRARLQAEMVAPSQGSSVMIGRILDLVFVQVLRAWASTAVEQSSWLTGALDPDIKPALAALHQEPSKPWTVAQLAEIANLSRSTFAARFTRLVGEPPSAYLTDLRLQSAARRILRSRTPIRVIAYQSGYSSEAAFSRAFRRKFDRTPSQWRAEPGRVAYGGRG